MQLHCLEVDSGEGGRPSQMAENSKTCAVSQTAYARPNGNRHTVWETACGVKEDSAEE